MHICSIFRYLFMAYYYVTFTSEDAKLCKGEIGPCIIHSTCKGEKLFLLLDNTYNFKNILNNWINRSTMHLPSNFKDIIGKNFTANFTL